MTRVAILTMQRSPNYGAVLQAYALQQTIAGFGVECEILDLLRPVHAGYRRTKKNAPLEPYAGAASGESQASLLGRAKMSAKTFLEFLVESQRRQRFRQFDQTYLKYSRQSFCCSDDLYDAELDYDAYVTGSDQLWNPAYPYSPEPYFLTFAPQGIPRIAYAPSFGVSEINEEVQPLYRRWLHDITHLSVRETHGADIVRQLTGRDAQVVLDPTFLLTGDEWKTIAKEPNMTRPYIFCYSLNDVPGLMSLCNHVQGITGYPVYKLGNIKDIGNWRIKAVSNAGPQEFLGYIMNAAMVITDAFHGTVFSLNMKKPFFTVPAPGKEANSTNSRFLSVLNLFSLSERLYNPSDRLPSLPDLDIAYGVSSPKLEIEREKSLSYLRHSICGGQQEVWG